MDNIITIKNQSKFGCEYFNIIVDGLPMAGITEVNLSTKTITAFSGLCDGCKSIVEGDHLKQETRKPVSLFAADSVGNALFGWG